MIKTIKVDFPISGTQIFLPFKAVCSVTDEEFSGTVVIEYHPKEFVLEYVDAEKFINTVCEKDLTAEDLVNETYKAVEESIQPTYLKILVDVIESQAHQPVKVWRESDT